MYNPILVYGESVMSVGIIIIIIIIIIILDKLSVGIIIFYQKQQLLEWSTRKKIKFVDKNERKEKNISATKEEKRKRIAIDRILYTIYRC